MEIRIKSCYACNMFECNDYRCFGIDLWNKKMDIKIYVLVNISV